jgi:hypothetical protein
MPETIYAAFIDPYHAENAAGALLDHGVPASDISLILSEEYRKQRGTVDDPELGYVQQTISAGTAGHTGRFDPLGNDLRNSGEVQVLGGELGPGTEYTRDQIRIDETEIAHDSSMRPLPHGTPEAPVMDNAEIGLPTYDAEQAAKHGITTTTPQDAARGAAQGGGLGVGVGAFAALAAVLVPGFGLILGGGVLATAVAGIAATAGAGAVAGGVFGFLKDQGVPAHDIPKYQQVYDDGGAILSVSLSGRAQRSEVEDVLAKYGAHLVDRYGYAA